MQYITRFRLFVTAICLLAITGFGVVHADAMSLSGQLSGLNNHVSTGTVSIVKNGDAYEIVFGDDFTFDGAPDPKVALGKDGEYDPDTLIELLRSNSGAQSYAVPASIDVSQYNEVHIWCEKYAVGLAVAKVQ